MTSHLVTAAAVAGAAFLTAAAIGVAIAGWFHTRPTRRPDSITPEGDPR